MIQIYAIEIAYFRSIHKTRLRGMSDLVVLAGRNDVGKSNILKAVNLFFNNQTDWNTPFDFQRDFSRKRLSEVRKDTIKGKQYVQVKIGFERGSRYDKTRTTCRSGGSARTWAAKFDGLKSMDHENGRSER